MTSKRYEGYVPLIKLGYDYEDLAVGVNSNYCDSLNYGESSTTGSTSTITGSLVIEETDEKSKTTTISSSYEALFRDSGKSKRAIEAANETFEKLCRMEEAERKKMEESILNLTFRADIKELLPKPKHVQFNGDYTTIVWKDGTSTVLHLMEGEEYDPEKAILYGILKKIFNNRNCDLNAYLEVFTDRTVTLLAKKEKEKNKKPSKKKSNRR